MNFFRKFFRKVFPHRTKVDFSGGYIPHRFFLERITEGPVLVIGDYTGRDYPAIKEKVGKAYLLDVANTGVASKEFFVEQSLTDSLPFTDNFFKAVLLTEVIEHIWEDKKALEELRRVLVPDGKLLISIPFWNDFHDRHYHIYSPITAELLITHSGYKIIEKNYRGLVTSIPYEAGAFLAMLLWPFFRDKSLGMVNEMLYRLHMALGSRRRLNMIFRFRRVFKRCGVSIVAVKSEPFIDPILKQKSYFEEHRND